MEEINIQKKLLMWTECPVCKGEGYIEKHWTFQYICLECKGSGKVRKPIPNQHPFKRTLL
jgi:DnaJ-class molecular chaperone